MHQDSFEVAQAAARDAAAPVGHLNQQAQAQSPSSFPTTTTETAPQLLDQAQPSAVSRAPPNADLAEGTQRPEETMQRSVSEHYPLGEV